MASQTMEKSTRYHFTLNNYTQDSYALLDAIECVYMVYGREVAKTGTPHLQGFVIFANAKRLLPVTKLIPGAHISMAYESTEKGITYCKKEGDFVERGVPPVNPGKREKIKWDQVLKAAQEGNEELIPDQIRFKYPKLIKSHRKFATVDTNSQHQWYYGESGTGKSRKAREDHPNAYLKMANKWWDDYNGQEVVIIEDFDQEHACLCHHLKIWGDRYAFPAEIKGGKIDIRPKLIIITSNYHPNQIWYKEQDIEPILRRFHITHFNGLFK